MHPPRKVTHQVIWAKPQTEYQHEASISLLHELSAKSNNLIRNLVELLFGEKKLTLSLIVFGSIYFTVLRNTKNVDPAFIKWIALYRSGMLFFEKFSIS